MNKTEMKSIENNLDIWAASTAKAALAKELADLSAYCKAAAVRITRLAEHVKDYDGANAEKAVAFAALTTATALILDTATDAAAAKDLADKASTAVVKDLNVLGSEIATLTGKKSGA